MKRKSLHLTWKEKKKFENMKRICLHLSYTSWAAHFALTDLFEEKKIQRNHLVNLQNVRLCHKLLNFNYIGNSNKESLDSFRWNSLKFDKLHLVIIYVCVRMTMSSVTFPLSRTESTVTTPDLETIYRITQSNLLDYFPDSNNDGINIKFFHRANSKEEMNEALNGEQFAIDQLWVQ